MDNVLLSLQADPCSHGQALVPDGMVHHLSIFKQHDSLLIAVKQDMAITGSCTSNQGLSYKSRPQVLRHSARLA